MIEVFVVIKDNTHRYYLLKVQRRGFDIYCFPPHLSIHCTVHESGEGHFTFERKAASKSGREPPVVLQQGEAGTPINNGIMRASLNDLGRAAGICTAHYPINSLSNDFEEFQRSAGKCFVIDKNSFSEDVRGVEVGIWAVPARNEASFEFNNPNISSDLYKVASCEPQIWIHARPSVLFV
jgi:hypothetical protein